MRIADVATVPSSEPRGAGDRRATRSLARTAANSMSSSDSLTLASPVSLPTAHYLFGRQRRLGEVLHRGHLGRAQRRVPHPHRSPRLQPLYVIPRPTRSRDRSMASSSIFFLAARLRDASFPSKRRAATPAIGVIYGIFRRSLLPRQQSANHNVPGFPQQRSTRRTPPPRTCSTPATTPVSPTCPISTSTCVPTLSFTPEPYASESAIRENRGKSIRQGLENAVFLVRPLQSAGSVDSLSFDEDTCVFLSFRRRCR